MNATAELESVIYKARWVDGIKGGQLVSDAALAKTIREAGAAQEAEALTAISAVLDGWLNLDMTAVEALHKIVAISNKNREGATV
jgi:hypothetical protein